MKNKDSNGKIKIWNIWLNILLISEMNQNENLSILNICQNLFEKWRKGFYYFEIEWEEFDWRDETQKMIDFLRNQCLYGLNEKMKWIKKIFVLFVKWKFVFIWFCWNIFIEYTFMFFFIIKYSSIFLINHHPSESTHQASTTFQREYSYYSDEYSGNLMCDVYSSSTLVSTCTSFYLEIYS
jgi:hypothetical protein